MSSTIQPQDGHKTAPQRIDEVRKEAEISLRAAAAAAGISDPRWRQVVNGHKTPVETLALMALAVGLTPADLQDPAQSELSDTMSELIPTYEASVEMRARIGAIAREAMTSLEMGDSSDLAREASKRRPRISKGVAKGFLEGNPWPTAPELKAICWALHWDVRAVEELIWSGEEPSKVTATSLITNHVWRAGLETRLSKLETDFASLRQ